MREQKLLVSFEVMLEQKMERFNIYGECIIETGKDHSDREYVYPEFDALSARKVEDGKEIPYGPTGTSWTGRRYNVYDMIQSYICSLIQGSSQYVTIFQDKKLQELVESYMAADEIAITVHDRKIPKRILGSDMDAYELVMVTDQYIYYADYDKMLMLRTSDHTIVSDNYFASVGYTDSIENIKEGKEKVIWKKRF